MNMASLEQVCQQQGIPQAWSPSWTRTDRQLAPENFPQNQRRRVRMAEGARYAVAWAKGAESEARQPSAQCPWEGTLGER